MTDWVLHALSCFTWVMLLLLPVAYIEQFWTEHRRKRDR